jgi:hypothetical protein
VCENIFNNSRKSLIFWKPDVHIGTGSFQENKQTSPEKEPQHSTC